MDDLRLLQRWFAALRVATGGVFVYMGIGHALGGWATTPGFQRAIAGFVERDPFPWYTAVVAPVVLGAPAVFGPLFVFGMIATGLGLVFGALTIPAPLPAIWLSANNLLMGFSGGAIHHSVNVLMLVIEVALLQTGAWRPYSLDALVGRGAFARTQQAVRAS